jgi:hypothetical protein
VNDPQPDLFDYIAARDEALACVAANAEESFPDFSERACAFVLGYLAERGPSSGEAITDACKRAGIRPHDDRAFGAVYMRLSRRGLIRKQGLCVRTKGHGTAGGHIWGLASMPPAW